MKTVILSQRYSDDFRIVESAARELGYSVYRMHGSDLSDVPLSGGIIVYTEGFIAEYVSQELDVVIFRPLIDALAKVDEDLLRRKVEFLKKADLQFANELPVFIKPADQKFF
jgi:hypothetical protein